MVADSVLAAIIGSGSVLGNGLLGSISSAISGRRSYKYARRLAEQQYEYSKQLQASQNAFTENLANTAHQREVADLRAAGLNPILSATGGSGAATPSAGSAMTGLGSVSGTDVDLAGAATSAIDLFSNLKLRKSQRELNEDSAKLTRAQEKGAVWDALTKQQYYDEIQPLEADKIKAEIANQTAVSAAQVRNYDSQSKAALMNALSNEITAKSNADWNRRRATGHSESFDDSYSTNDSYQNGHLGPGSWLPSKGGSSAYSHSRRRSRTW